MLHILFLILKLIGMILLVILGILLLLLCTVFFMPANYLIQAKTDDGIKALSFEAKAHWFLHLCTVYYIYKDKQSDWQVRVGWKTFNHKDHKSSSKSEMKEDGVIIEEVESSEKSDVSQGQIYVEQSKVESDTETITKSSKKQCEKQSWFQKIKCTILKICDKIKSFWETKEKITMFLTDDVHVEAFKIIKKEIGILARHLRPRRIKGFIRFGFDDPYRTGQLLAGFSILYPFYGEHVEIYPDFEQKILEGDLYVKGHIRMLHLAALLWRLFFNRYVRKTYRDYKKIKSN